MIRVIKDTYTVITDFEIDVESEQYEDQEFTNLKAFKEATGFSDFRSTTRGRFTFLHTDGLSRKAGITEVFSFDAIVELIKE